MQKREVEYDKYQRDKLNIAKNEFRSLLRETKVITYKSCELVKESSRHYKDIIDVLKVREGKIAGYVLEENSFLFLRMTSVFWCLTVSLVRGKISCTSTWRRCSIKGPLHSLLPLTQGRDSKDHPHLNFLIQLEVYHEFTLLSSAIFHHSCCACASWVKKWYWSSSSRGIMMLALGKKWSQEPLARGFALMVCRNVVSSSSDPAKSQFVIMSEKFHKPGE